MNSASDLERWADPRQVDRDNADRAGQGIGAEEAATAFFQFAVVDPEPAAHAARIFRVHIGIDEVGEIRNPVFRGHLP